MNQPDYYATLGVDNRATAAEIKAAYLQLARQYHPDHNTSTTALGTRFQQITAAYSVLSDPVQRANYDAANNKAHAPKGPPPPRGHAGGHSTAGRASIAVAPATPTRRRSRLRRAFGWLRGHPRSSGVLSGILVIALLAVVGPLAMTVRTTATDHPGRAASRTPSGAARIAASTAAPRVIPTVAATRGAPATIHRGRLFSVAGRGPIERKFDTAAFRVRGTFAVHYTVTPDPQLGAYDSGTWYASIQSNAGESDSIGDKDLMPGSTPEKGVTTESHFDCSAGCYVSIDAQGVVWSLYVTH